MALLPGGRTHQGGNSKGICTQRSVNPLATGQPAIPPCTRRHISPAIGQMGITQEFSSQSITGHLPSSDWSLENITTGESQYTPATCHWSSVTGHRTLYQPSFSETHAMGMEFTSNSAS